MIFICTFDPFKLGRHVYTFRKFCCEDKNLALDDGETTMFLNTRGKDKVSNEMKAFLDFVMGRECDDPFIQKLKRRMELAKHNGKWRQEYMIASIRETDLRYEGRAEGFAKGRAEGIVTGRAEGIVTGRGEEKSEIARRMLMHGDDEDYIHLITGLSSEEIRRLAWS